MQYELECGHCGYQFVLDVTVLPRTTTCPVCGGALTLAVPRPIGPPVIPPPPKPVPPPPAPAKPAPAPLPPVSDDTPPKPRPAPRPAPIPRALPEPWPSVRAALNWDVAAVGFATAFLFVLVVVAVFADPRGWPDGRGSAEPLATFAEWVVLLPAILHAAALFQCASVPRTHGRVLINASLAVLFFSIGGWWLGWRPGVAEVPFAVGVAPGAFLSLMFWLMFLGRLGGQLGDDELLRATRVYQKWLLFGLVQAAALLVGANLAESASIALVRLGRGGAGAIFLFLLWKYSALLRTAVDAIDRRVPHH